MISELIKNFKVMVEILGEEGAEDSINTMIIEGIDSVEDFCYAISDELSYMADESN